MINGPAGLVFALLIVVVALLFHRAAMDRKGGGYDDLGDQMNKAIFGVFTLVLVLYVVQYQFWVLVLRGLGQLQYLPTFIVVSQFIAMFTAAGLFIALGIKLILNARHVVHVKVHTKPKHPYSFKRYLVEVRNTILPIMFAGALLSGLLFLWEHAVIFTPLH